MSVVTIHMIGILEGGKVRYNVTRSQMLRLLGDVLNDTALDLERLAWSLSTKVGGGKGSMWMIGGCFNYFSMSEAKEIARLLSHELETEVMQMSWFEEGDYQCAVFKEGIEDKRDNNLPTH